MAIGKTFTTSTLLKTRNTAFSPMPEGNGLWIFPGAMFPAASSGATGRSFQRLQPARTKSPCTFRHFRPLKTFPYRSEECILIISIAPGRVSALLCLLGAALWAPILSAQKYQPDDSIPPGAQGKVQPIQGTVVEIK